MEMQRRYIDAAALLHGRRYSATFGQRKQDLAKFRESFDQSLPAYRFEQTEASYGKRIGKASLDIEAFTQGATHSIMWTGQINSTVLSELSFVLILSISLLTVHELRQYCLRSSTSDGTELNVLLFLNPPYSTQMSSALCVTWTWTLWWEQFKTAKAMLPSGIFSPF